MAFLDAEKVKVALSFSAIIAIIAAVGGGAWVASEANANMLNKFESQGRDIGEIKDAIGKLATSVEKLSDDHDDFIRRSDLRVELKRLEAMNTELLREGGGKGLRLAPQE